jgi:hypothetical protein
MNGRSVATARVNAVTVPASAGNVGPAVRRALAGAAMANHSDRPRIIAVDPVSRCGGLVDPVDLRPIICVVMADRAAVGSAGSNLMAARAVTVLRRIRCEVALVVLRGRGTHPSVVPGAKALVARRPCSISEANSRRLRAVNAVRIPVSSSTAGRKNLAKGLPGVARVAVTGSKDSVAWNVPVEARGRAAQTGA